MTSARSITISCRSRPLTGLFQASVTFTSAHRRLMSVLIRLGDGGSLVLDAIIWLDTDLLRKHHCHRCWVTSAASITAHWLDNITTDLIDDEERHIISWYRVNLHFLAEVSHSFANRPGESRHLNRPLTISAGWCHSRHGKGITDGSQ
jgi:hypothetical protein